MESGLRLWFLVRTALRHAGRVLLRCESEVAMDDEGVWRLLIDGILGIVIVVVLDWKCGTFTLLVEHPARMNIGILSRRFVGQSLPSLSSV